MHCVGQLLRAHVEIKLSVFVYTSLDLHAPTVTAPSLPPYLTDDCQN